LIDKDNGVLNVDSDLARKSLGLLLDLSDGYLMIWGDICDFPRCSQLQSHCSFVYIVYLARAFVTSDNAELWCEGSEDDHEWSIGSQDGRGAVSPSFWPIWGFGEQLQQFMIIGRE
jgi:hypothetical protein